MEQWVEVNLFGPGDRQDEVLLRNLVPYVNQLKRRGVLVTYHYFREPEIRFRVRLKTAREKARQKAELTKLARTLSRRGLIDKWAFGNHGVEGEEYVGEEDRYGTKGWAVAQEYFEHGAETALKLLSLREKGGLENPLWGKGIGNPWEGGERNPWRGERSDPREFHWSRYVHLFSNQLGFDMLKEAEQSERQAEKYREVVREFGIRW